MVGTPRCGVRSAQRADPTFGPWQRLCRQCFSPLATQVGRWSPAIAIIATRPPFLEKMCGMPWVAWSRPALGPLRL